MGISGDLAVPQDVVIGGRKAKLHPLYTYEYGRTEADYEACLRYLAIKSTMGLPQNERNQALDAAAQAVSMLAVDMQPLLEWIILRNEGMCSAVVHCLEFADGGAPNVHAVSAWMHQQDRDTGNVTKWAIDSGLRPDPIDGPPSETDQSEPQSSKSGENDSAESTGQSSGGATSESSPNESSKNPSHSPTSSGSSADPPPPSVVEVSDSALLNSSG